jgi:perosamine synthetase
VTSVAPRIPWAQPILRGNDEAYVLEALRSTWISGGEFIDRLEQGFADFIGVPYARAVASGTAALHVAYMAAGIGPGDELIIPSLTFAGAAAMAVACGAVPRFADCDAETLMLDPASVRRAITSRTKAIVAVHLFGHACNLDELTAVARESNVLLIEDAAQALGTLYDGEKVGAFGDISCFSFQAAKTITMGEGGMITTRDAGIAERVSVLRNHGFRPGLRYWHDVVGFNYRITNLQAALGYSQFERIQEILQERRRIFENYVRCLGDCPGVRVPALEDKVAPALWIQPIELDEAYYPQGREAVRKTLADQGIETRPMFYPAHTLPPYRQFQADCPVTERVSPWAMTLPVFETLPSAEIEFICDALRAAATPR